MFLMLGCPFLTDLMCAQDEDGIFDKSICQEQFGENYMQGVGNLYIMDLQRNWNTIEIFYLDSQTVYTGFFVTL